MVGLGNPGRDYDNTPHNVGFVVMDLLAKRSEAGFRGVGHANALVARVTLDGQAVLLVKPETYVNRSGEAVSGILQYHHATMDNLMVVLDDADLPVGSLRIRGAGSSGGHRGLASIIEQLGGESFARMRIGVGRDSAGANLVTHVLKPFSAGERPAVDDAVKNAVDAVGCWVSFGVERTMNTFNTRKTRGKDGGAAGNEKT